jgi:geranylgeranyl diphosphate synthase type I
MTDSILNLFAERSIHILSHSRRFLERQKSELAGINRWSADIFDRLIQFMEQGKCIRGNLVLLGGELGGADVSSGMYDAAAAIELFQSSILIHDDIIDQDTVRRGATTIHTQYTETAAAELQSDNAPHIGASLAICVGDVGFNLTYALLAAADLPDRIKTELTRFWGVEFAKVGLAEMDDVYMAFSDGAAGLDRILSLYRYKTARYTFCVPFLTGLTIADAKEKLRDQVEELGDVLGLMFQIKDDELGIFGDEKTVGKPVGSDIRENKKTLFHHYLMALDDEHLRSEASALFRRSDITADDVRRIRDIITETGIKETIASRMQELCDRAQTMISHLDVSASQRNYLMQLVQYNTNREQ